MRARSESDFAAPPDADAQRRAHSERGETPLEITLSERATLRLALPAGMEDACDEGRARVHRVAGDDWTPINHRCETSAGGATYAAIAIDRFGEYALTVSQTAPTPTAQGYQAATRDQERACAIDVPEDWTARNVNV